MKTETYNYAAGVKRVTWPPEHEYNQRAGSITRQSPAFQPQHRQPSPHPNHYQNGGYNHSSSTFYRQPSPVANYPNAQTVNYHHQQNYPVQQQQSPYGYHQQQQNQQPNYQEQSPYHQGYPQQQQQQHEQHHQQQQQQQHQPQQNYQQQQIQTDRQRQPSIQRQVAEKVGYQPGYHPRSRQVSESSGNQQQQGYQGPQQQQQQQQQQPQYQPQQNYPQQPNYRPQIQTDRSRQPSTQRQVFEKAGYQPGYQRQISEKSQYPSAQNFNNPDPTFMRQSTPSYLQAPQSVNPQGCTAAFAGGISIANKPPTPPAQSQGQHHSGNWSHVQPSRPVHSGYVQPRHNQQSTYPQSANAINQNQFQPQLTYHHQPQQQQQQQQQQQHQQQQHQQYQQQQSAPIQQPSTQQIQYQTSQSVQPQPQKQYRPEDNFYRHPSPGTITLRKELPTTQQPPAVYASEPAAHSFGGGGNMRGDQKWPPEDYVKRQSEIDNEQRRQLALGPATRPRRVNKDYTSFFQRHALNSTFPGYRAPPGTQHHGLQYPQYPQQFNH